MFVKGSLVLLKPTKKRDDYISCWYEDKIKNRINAYIFRDKIVVGLYVGVWDKQTNGLTWHKVLIGKIEYLFTLDQMELYVE